MTDLPRFVADTHALLWDLDENPRLSPTAGSHFVAADSGEPWIYVSVISLVEMIYLADRGRFDSAVTTHVLNLLATSNGSYSPVEIDLDTVRSLRLVPRAAVPDMPDRIITATALSLNLPLITVDERIRASGVVPIVW